MVEASLVSALHFGSPCRSKPAWKARAVSGACLKLRLGNKIIASDLKILQVNAALVKLLGHSEKEELFGSLIPDYSPPEHHEEWRYLQQQFIRRHSGEIGVESQLG